YHNVFLVFSTPVLMISALSGYRLNSHTYNQGKLMLSPPLDDPDPKIFLPLLLPFPTIFVPSENPKRYYINLLILLSFPKNSLAYPSLISKFLVIFLVPNYLVMLIIMILNAV